MGELIRVVEALGSGVGAACMPENVSKIFKKSMNNYNYMASINEILQILMKYLPAFQKILKIDLNFSQNI